MANIWSRETPFFVSDDRYGIVVEKVGLAISLALEFSRTTTKTCFTGDAGFVAAPADWVTPAAPTPRTLAAAMTAAPHCRTLTARPPALG